VCVAYVPELLTDQMPHEEFGETSRILSSLIYAKTLEAFNQSLAVLGSLFPLALAYLEGVWLPVHHKWALYSTSKNINLGCISSRVEGTHSAIKRYLTKKVEVLLAEIKERDAVFVRPHACGNYLIGQFPTIYLQ
jgi:hypothetical protein